MRYIFFNLVLLICLQLKAMEQTTNPSEWLARLGRLYVAEDLDEYIGELQKNGLFRAVSEHVQYENEEITGSHLHLFRINSVGQILYYDDIAFDDFVDRCALVAAGVGEDTQENSAQLSKLQMLISVAFRRATKEGKEKCLAKLIVGIGKKSHLYNWNQGIWYGAEDKKQGYVLDMIEDGLRESNSATMPHIVNLLRNNGAIKMNERN